jgi:hypothetical protein
VPPVAVTGIALPLDEVLSAFVMPMLVADVVEAMVMVTTTTTPFGIMFVLSWPGTRPVRKHV